MTGTIEKMFQWNIESLESEIRSNKLNIKQYMGCVKKYQEQQDELLKRRKEINDAMESKYFQDTFISANK